MHATCIEAARRFGMSLHVCVVYLILLYLRATAIFSRSYMLCAFTAVSACLLIYDLPAKVLRRGNFVTNFRWGNSVLGAHN